VTVGDPSRTLLAYTSATSSDVMPRPFPQTPRAAPAPKARSSELARRRIGVSGLIVFTFGVLLAPLAHTIGHRADHVHRQGHFALALDGLRKQLDARAHEHAHAHGHPHAHGPGDSPAHDSRPSDASQRDERRGSDPHHGEGSLAHFASAVLAAAIFVVPPAFVATASTVPASLESVSDGRAPRGPSQPRAPPA
jgi:hypothetical protein